MGLPLPIIIQHEMINKRDYVEENSKNGKFLPYELVYAATPSETTEQAHQ